MPGVASQFAPYEVLDSTAVPVRNVKRRGVGFLPEVATLGRSLRLGRTLSCSRGTWNDDGVPAYPTSIQWTRNNEPIAGHSSCRPGGVLRASRPRVRDPESARPGRVRVG